MSDNRICNDHAANFDTLTRAFAEGQVVLLDCIEKSTNEHVAVICAISTEDGNTTFIPFAKFFNGNPFDLLIPPTQYNNNHQL